MKTLESDRMQFLSQLMSFKDLVGFQICREKLKDTSLNKLYEMLVLQILQEYQCA